MNWKALFARIGLCLLAALVLTCIGSGIVFLFWNGKPHFTDALFWVGLVVFIVGCMMSMKGSPVLGSLASWGKNNTAYLVNVDTYAAKTDRGSPEYYKHYFQNSVVEFSFWRTVLILSGGGMIAVCIIFSKL